MGIRESIKQCKSHSELNSLLTSIPFDAPAKLKVWAARKAVDKRAEFNKAEQEKKAVEKKALEATKQQKKVEEKRKQRQQKRRKS